MDDARLPSVPASFPGALVIIGALDLLSGGAISSLGRSETLGPFAFGVFIAIPLGNVTYLAARRRRTGR